MSIDPALIEIQQLGFDPRTQPMVSLPSLPAINQAYLEAAALQRLFNRPVPVQWGVDPVLSNEFVFDFNQKPDARPSAVCVPLIARESGLSVLFTRRAGHLPSHAGQVCFPGGRIDATDINAIAAALRETHEEVGIDRQSILPLGEQPIYVTPSQYAMRPVIGLVNDDVIIKPNPAEVAQVFEVPLSVLMNPENHRLQYFFCENGQRRYYYSIQWQGHYIWGATAALVRNFYHFLAAASY